MESNEKKIELKLHAAYDVHTLSAARLAEIILQGKSGAGLRSWIPHVYVWNDDQLYIVSRISFPGRAASGDMRENVSRAVDLLRCLGYFPHLREAVFHSMYMRDPRTISKKTTWWGMNNVEKFKCR